MWVEKIPNGYAFRETFIDPLTGKRCKVSISKSKTSQKAAYEAIQEKIKKKCAGR